MLQVFPGDDDDGGVYDDVGEDELGVMVLLAYSIVVLSHLVVIWLTIVSVLVLLKMLKFSILLHLHVDTCGGVDESLVLFKFSWRGSHASGC